MFQRYEKTPDGVTDLYYNQNYCKSIKKATIEKEQRPKVEYYDEYSENNPRNNGRYNLILPIGPCKFPKHEYVFNYSRQPLKLCSSSDVGTSVSPNHIDKTVTPTWSRVWNEFFDMKSKKRTNLKRCHKGDEDKFERNVWCYACTSDMFPEHDCDDKSTPHPRKRKTSVVALYQTDVLESYSRMKVVTEEREFSKSTITFETVQAGFTNLEPSPTYSTSIQTDEGDLGLSEKGTQTFSKSADTKKSKPKNSLFGCCPQSRSRKRKRKTVGDSDSDSLDDLYSLANGPTSASPKGNSVLQSAVAAGPFSCRSPKPQKKTLSKNL